MKLNMASRATKAVLMKAKMMGKNDSSIQQLQSEWEQITIFIRQVT